MQDPTTDRVVITCLIGALNNALTLIADMSTGRNPETWDARVFAIRVWVENAQALNR